MTAQFENSKAVMVTHYQGLTMPQLDELRSKMREHGIVIKITKNRKTKLALEKHAANVKFELIKADTSELSQNDIREKLNKKGIRILHTFDITSAAWVTVPKPSPSDTISSFIGSYS